MMIKLTRLVPLTALGTSLMLGYAGCARSSTSLGERPSAPGTAASPPVAQIDDESLNERVATVLAADEVIGGFSIESRTVDGVVWLTGMVQDERDIRRAERLVLEVAGVFETVNHLQVELGVEELPPETLD